MMCLVVEDPDTLDPDVERRLHAPAPQDLEWIRERVRAETARRRETLEGCGDTLYALCFLLYLLGDAEDCRLIYAAKHANMDCGAMIDSGLLSMRRTFSELGAALDPVRDAPLRKDLESLFRAQKNSRTSKTTCATISASIEVEASLGLRLISDRRDRASVDDVLGAVNRGGAIGDENAIRSATS
jgi:hypothetical protein